MGPSDLAQVLCHLPETTRDRDLLVGFETSDDAGIYRLTPDLALVQTVDFFTPIVDDPYDFGCIAAANALSDVYAMGGKPVTVMNLAAFPVGTIELEVLADILRGGADKIAESGATLVGGHTIDDVEPKYGLSVTGIVHPDRILRNSTCRPGDVIVLTKPIGVGIINTAAKAGLASAELIGVATKVMAELNKKAAEAMLQCDVHACTDITGFGLAGHLLEMAKGSGLSLQVDVAKVPVIPEAYSFAADEVVPGGTYKNLEYFGEWVEFSGSIPEHVKLVMCDAMTSGGLAIAVAPQSVTHLLALLNESGVSAHAIAQAVSGNPNVVFR